MNQGQLVARDKSIVSSGVMSQGGGGGTQAFFLTGMLVREQISTTQKNRMHMTLNSNPQKIECPKIQTQKIE